MGKIQGISPGVPLFIEAGCIGCGGCNGYAKLVEEERKPTGASRNVGAK